VSGSSRPREFSPAWIEERWRPVPSVAEDFNESLRLVTDQDPPTDPFDWISGRGLTPALIEVTLPEVGRKYVGPDGVTRTSKLVNTDTDYDYDHSKEQTRADLPRLRPLLPDDCFPFGVTAGGCSFATGQAPSLPELQTLGERLLTELERFPRQRLGLRRGLVHFGPRVRICLADDGSDRGRAVTINAMGAPPTDARGPLIVASTRHRGVHNTALSSAARLLELDLPRLHAERPGCEISLLGLTPDEPCWRSILERGYAPYVWWDISCLVCRWGAERGVNACELALGEMLPLGLPLALPPREAELELEGLAEYLSQHGYDYREYQTGHAAVVAQPGELEFRTACVPVPPDSKGSAELEKLRARLGGVES